MALFGTLFGAILLGLELPCAAAEELDQAVAELRTRYASRLEQLAVWCERHALPEQAQTTRGWLSPHRPDQVFVAQFPREFSRHELPADASADLRQWDQQFFQLRREQADALEALARRAVQQGRASVGFELLLTALHENPDQESIRRLLGYVKSHGAWATSWELSRQRAGQLWHAKFGWIPKGWLRRYEQGQRNVNGQWISAEQDAQLHRTIQSGWDIETEHYVIRTNHSREAGVALGEKLERLYRVWKQLFIRYFATEEQLAALFEGRARDNWIRLPQHRVVYFRSREEYNEALRPTIPNIGMSIGFYTDRTRQAYFFAGEGYDERTLYHEATHQLFHESRPVAPDVGARGNFWAIEGIAMFMESLHEEHGYYVLGGLDDARMVAARYRLLHDQFYVPLAELSKLAREPFQAHPQIAMLYSQSAGLTHFLFNDNNGRYRDALVNYLRTIYSGQDDPSTLLRLTGASAAELDRQYREFIQAAGMP